MGLHIMSKHFNLSANVKLDSVRLRKFVGAKIFAYSCKVN